MSSKEHSPLHGGRKLAVAIRHVHFEHCGTLGKVLDARGFEVQYVEPYRGALTRIDLAELALLISLGGPVGVYDDTSYPWIRDELRLLERALSRGTPLIGICLGAQLIAHVLGARVYRAPAKELGWAPLELSPQGRHSSVAYLAPEYTSMLHWHGDTFDLPTGASLLASTALLPHQIYSWHDSVLAFQCHPEIMREEFEAWLIGHAVEIGATPGVTIEALRSDTERLAGKLATQATLCFNRWINALSI